MQCCVLGSPGSKRLVAVQRARFGCATNHKDFQFPVFVHKIRLDNDQLEVWLDRDVALNSLQLPSRVSVSSLAV